MIRSQGLSIPIPIRTLVLLYLDPNTSEHLELARNVTEEVNRIFRIKFPKIFVRCKVDGFWKGSVGVNMTLAFKSQEVVPSSSTVVAFLSAALSTGGLYLNIIPGSINAWETRRSTTPTPVPEVSNPQTSQASSYTSSLSAT
ncbi:hypothetical protein AGOR_G00232300 [Albula goreensis]|uniref:SEA domain-containing protein n=1 Tax=Albula goreensis TaxID=1534307 RepID=A0A8T3CHJ7_9TELE|nr:hypothetical protein AGOR_G00232300 [Albula goreensis]